MLKTNDKNSKNMGTRERENYPNFLCVGAAKAGTTTFSDMLRKHPQVFAPQIKELHYFDCDEYQYKNKIQYSTHFMNSEQYKIRVEFTPGYLWFKEVPSRIVELLGQDTKILILLRNPVDRAYSHYTMHRNRGRDDVPFEIAFKNEAKRVKIDSNGRRYYSYFDRGLYANQVRRYLDCFNNVKIVIFEDFVRNTDQEMESIYEFLDIDNIHIPLTHSNEQQKLRSVKFNTYMKKLRFMLSQNNVIRRISFLKKIDKSITQLNRDPTKPKEKIDPAFAKVLQDYYYDDICELEKLIGRDLTAWKTKY